MPSRNIPIAIEDSLLAACVYFLEGNGIEVQGSTPSDVVSVALKTFATFLHDEGLIPEGGVKNPTEYIDSKLEKLASQPPAVLDLGNLKSALRKVVDASADIKTIPDATLQTLLSDATDYDIPIEVPEPIPVATAPTEAAPIDLDHPPWEGVDSVPFAELQAIAPKDMLIEILTANPDAAMQKAMEVVYAVYPINHWSTEACTQLVKDTAEKFRPYMG